MAPLLQVEGISKSFPGVRALDSVSITLERGEVLGIVGENGAGKSTLVKILGGAYRADAGRILLDGAPLVPRGPREALAQGIIVIYQELSLVPDQTVAENIFLGHLPHVPLLSVVRRSALNREAGRLLERVGLRVSPRTRVRRLSLAQRQLVEIARALSRRARVIVMDEPTSSLTESELRTLVETIRALTVEGVGIIFISHHLDEVFAVCDRVTVMRDGQTVETRPTAEWTTNSLVQVMVNRPITQLYPKEELALGAPRLEVRSLASPGRFADVSFAVRSGEIVGLAGLIGAGRTEVAKTLYGALRRGAGEVLVDGKPVRIRSPRDALRVGIVLVPEDRKGEGLILPFQIRQNMGLSVLGQLSTAGVFPRPGRINRVARSAVDQLGIRTPSIYQRVINLSGGNQQKVVLGRTLTVQPRIFVLDEPTRGIDVGAKVEVYKLITELARGGAAVLIVSSELLELLGLCDRILVMREGRLAGEVPRAQFSQERVMKLAATGATG